MMISLLMSTGIAQLTKTEWEKIHDITQLTKRTRELVECFPESRWSVPNEESKKALSDNFATHNHYSKQSKEQFIKIIVGAVARARNRAQTRQDHTPITLIYVGDTLADRLGDDRWSYTLRNALIQAGVQVFENISNHNCEAIHDISPLIFPPSIENHESMIERKQARSSYLLIKELADKDKSQEFKTEMFDPYSDTYALTLYDAHSRQITSHTVLYRKQNESDEEGLCRLLTSLSAEITAVLTCYTDDAVTSVLWPTHIALIKDIKEKCLNLDFKYIKNRKLLEEWSATLNLAFQDMVKNGLVNPNSTEKKFLSFTKSYRTPIEESAFEKITWARSPTHNATQEGITTPFTHGTHGHVGPGHDELPGNLDDNEGKTLLEKYNPTHTKQIAVVPLNPAPMMQFVKRKKSIYMSCTADTEENTPQALIDTLRIWENNALPIPELIKASFFSITPNPQPIASCDTEAFAAAENGAPSLVDTFAKLTSGNINSEIANAMQTVIASAYQKIVSLSRNINTLQGKANCRFRLGHDPAAMLFVCIWRAFARCYLLSQIAIKTEKHNALVQALDSKTSTQPNQAATESKNDQTYTAVKTDAAELNQRLVYHGRNGGQTGNLLRQLRGHTEAGDLETAPLIAMTDRA